MIAKYNDEYFKTGLPKSEMILSRYTPAEGFEEVSVGNLKYYQKTVSITEIQDLFLESFTVIYQGLICTPTVHKDMKTVTLTIEEEIVRFAEGLGFVKDEEFSEYNLEVNLDDCEEFRILKLHFYPNDKKEELKLSKEEWLDLYQKYEVNRILPSTL